MTDQANKPQDAFRTLTNATHYLASTATDRGIDDVHALHAFQVALAILHTASLAVLDERAKRSQA